MRSEETQIKSEAQWPYAQKKILFHKSPATIFWYHFQLWIYERRYKCFSLSLLFSLLRNNHGVNEPWMASTKRCIIKSRHWHRWTLNIICFHASHSVGCLTVLWNRQPSPRPIWIPHSNMFMLHLLFQGGCLLYIYVNRKAAPHSARNNYRNMFRLRREGNTPLAKHLCFKLPGHAQPTSLIAQNNSWFRLNNRLFIINSFL